GIRHPTTHSSPAPAGHRTGSSWSSSFAQICIATAMPGSVAETGGKPSRTVDVESEVIFIGKTDRTVQLNRLRSDQRSSIRGSGFGARSGQRKLAASHPLTSCANCSSRRVPGELLLNKEVDAAMLQCLKAADRNPELMTRPQIVERH